MGCYNAIVGCSNAIVGCCSIGMNWHDMNIKQELHEDGRSGRDDNSERLLRTYANFYTPCLVRLIEDFSQHKWLNKQAGHIMLLAIYLIVSANYCVCLRSITLSALSMHSRSSRM